MKRSLLLALIRAAGYHEDKANGMRLYVGGRISFPKFRKAFEEGRAQKRAGVPCRCRDCNPASPEGETR